MSWYLEGLKRIVTEEIESAAQQLEQQDPKRDEAIHESARV